MNNFLQRILGTFKSNKKLAIIMILCFISLLAQAIIIVFDIVQLIIVSINSAMLASGFFVLNYILMALCVLDMVVIVLFVVLKKRSITSKW